MLKSTVALYLHYYDIHDVLSNIFNDMTQDMVTISRSFILSKSKSISIRSVRKIQMESQYTGHCFWMMQLPLFFWKK